MRLGFQRLFFVALGASACAGPARAPTAGAIEWSEAVPAGYDSLGVASAECGSRPASGREFSGVPVTSFACGRAELERALLEQARARGGTVVARERCRETATRRSCTAVIARPAAGGTPGVSSGAELARESPELPVAVASRILVDLEPTDGPIRRRVRQPDDVAEFASLPVGHVRLGWMRAHCAAGDCDAEQARVGLRTAAGGLGVSALVGVRCFVLQGEQSCVALLAVSERDPEADASAR